MNTVTIDQPNGHDDATIAPTAPRKTAIAKVRPYRAKLRGLKTLDAIDARTHAYKRAVQLIEELQEAHGPDLTPDQRQHIQNAGILGVMIESLGAQWLAGEKIDHIALSTLVNAQRRTLQSL